MRVFKILGCSLLLNAALFATDAISVTTQQRIQFEPGYVKLKLSIEPNPGNRAYCVALESESYSTRSCHGLEGDAAPQTVWVDYKALPASEYQAVATVYRADGARGQAHTPFTVLSGR